MINHPEKKHIADLMKLWKLCFQDTDKFINFYFDKIFKEENSFIISENGSPVAFLQIIPYQMKIGKMVYNSGYVSGVMTHPDHRQKGYMNALMDTAFGWMKEQKYTFSFLIPQTQKLFDIYSKYNYEKAFPKSFSSIELKIYDHLNIPLVKVYDSFQQIKITELFDVYSYFLSQEENVVIKTKEQFELMLEDLFIDGGRVFYSENKGIAFVYPWKKQIAIKELFYVEESIKQLLLGAIKLKFNLEEAALSDYRLSKTSYFSGMVKQLDSEFSGEIPSNIYMSLMMDF